MVVGAASESSSPGNYTRVGSALSHVLVSPSDSLKLLWVLGALGDQPLSPASLEEQHLLNCCSGICCSTATHLED